MPAGGPSPIIRVRQSGPSPNLVLGGTSSGMRPSKPRRLAPRILSASGRWPTDCACAYWPRIGRQGPHTRPRIPGTGTQPPPPCGQCPLGPMRFPSHLDLAYKERFGPWETQCGALCSPCGTSLGCWANPGPRLGLCGTETIGQCLGLCGPDRNSEGTTLGCHRFLSERPKRTLGPEFWPEFWLFRAWVQGAWSVGDRTSFLNCGTRQGNVPKERGRRVFGAGALSGGRSQQKH